MELQRRQKNKLFNKILIASRGEIAVRLIKTIHRLGIQSVAIYTSDEKDCLHAQLATESYQLSGNDSLASFLDVHQIINLALKCGANAIHPGYGFLSENPIFAELCTKNGITFIGPSAEHIALMGDKSAAIEMAKLANVPTIDGAIGSIQTILNNKDSLKYPLLVKPAFGGGGKGMVHVLHPENLEQALNKAATEALRYFANDTVIVEHYIESPRHIEIQVLGDHFGNIIHLFERECSVQRRFQKIVEETPAPNLSVKKRDEIIADALKLANHIKYTNAGTVEFLLDGDGNHYFIEMNTRIQVEHPITEEVTGVDIVELQIEIASNLPLKYNQVDIQQNGYAIECRINAENPNDNFNPSPGDVFWLNNKDFSHLRIDTALKNHSKIVPSFDSLIAKVIAHQNSRDRAIDQMVGALNELAIKSKHNNINYLRNVLSNKNFRDGKYTTNFCNEYSEHLVHQIDMAVPFDFYFQIGWCLIRLKNHFKSPLKEGNPPINSLINLWSETEFCKTRLQIEWLNSQSAKVTISDADSIVIENIEVGENSIVYSIGNEIVNQLFLATKIDLVICQNLHFVHIWELGKKSLIADVKPLNVQNKEELTTSIPCRIVSINVKVGDKVAKGDTLAVVEAMKMENCLLAWKDGVVGALFFNAGDAIKAESVILRLKSH